MDVAGRKGGEEDSIVCVHQGIELRPLCLTTYIKCKIESKEGIQREDRIIPLVQSHSAAALGSNPSLG